MSSSRSLLDFLDAPVVVGDPDGRAVYVNPAFESRFGISREGAHGEMLSNLFAGGGREAVLRAVAGVCDGENSVRFRLREGATGYLALASPIVAEDDRVGVVILLTEEPEGEERVAAFHREIQEPLEDLTRCLVELAEQTGGRRNQRYKNLLDEGVRALGGLRKRAEDVQGQLKGRGGRK